MRWGGPVVSCFCVFNPLTPVAAEDIEAKGLGPRTASCGRRWNPVLECRSWIYQTEWFKGEQVTFYSDASGTSKLSSLERTIPSLGFRGPD